MPTTRSDHASPTVLDAPSGDRPTNAWVRPLVLLTVVVALGDVVFMALIPAVIEPLVAGGVLTLIGVALLQRWTRAAIALLGVTSLLIGVVAVFFLGAHLAHPGSPVDFLHAALAIAGRWLAVIAALGAWRGMSEAGARRLAAGALGLAGLAVAVSMIALLNTSGDPARAGDIAVVIAGSRFPETVLIEQGQTLHLDNQDVFRHTYTIPATGLDVDLPATTAVRATVELPPGRYDVICDIPGHEHMTAVLVVN